MSKRLFLYLLVLMFSPNRTATASDLTVEVAAAAGHVPELRCDKNNVYASAFGSGISVVFPNLGLRLLSQQNSVVRNQTGYCVILLNVVVPRGFTIATSRFNVLGGVMKDLGAHATIDTVFAFTERRPSLNPFVPVHAFGTMINLRRLFTEKSVADEPVFELNGSGSFAERPRRQLCQMTATREATIGLYLKLLLSVRRSSPTQTAILNLDAMDGHLDLTVTTARCDT